MPPKRPSSPGPVANGGSSKAAATSLNRDRTRDPADPGAAAHDERGEFEDAWEDEFEEEDIQSDMDDDEDDDGVEGVIRGGDTGMEDSVNGERSESMGSWCRLTFEELPSSSLSTVLRKDSSMSTVS